MGYTNKTSHYDLPQWIAGDKPSWLGDVNTAMLNIDTAIAGADASATAAESSAAAANAQVQAQEAKIAKNTTDIQALTESLADTQGEVTTIKATANGALPKSGGTMTGNLILNAAPTSDLQAATKKYVDDAKIVITKFTSTNTLTANPSLNLSGFAINTCISVSGNGKITSTINAQAHLLTVAGNPFNLAANSLQSIGSLLILRSNEYIQNLYGVIFDGEKTAIVAGPALQPNDIVWFNGNRAI